uniref:Cytochrome b-c1 complex subunit 10 n=1 Tax=Athene cunicularia TaxID=194338 RepID=A0A663MN91_ATHCN
PLQAGPGPRRHEGRRRRTPTLVTWGGVAGTGVIWITDWKLVLQYVPYIGGKFKTED